ncbi:hypothetical protein NC653_006369 [Populus alba x Populus x berolinensis]|uniref:Uncharacterized protein n=1 Tax=Populus alba x Populus x berolinensis TaxID=444605 RepID=A0AAD6RE43_9ROSI|nr:hypothetical protein NC653_006369 [Populus alba x Populus x berolinensis]
MIFRVQNLQIISQQKSVVILLFSLSYQLVYFSVTPNAEVQKLISNNH